MATQTDVAPSAGVGRRNTPDVLWRSHERLDLCVVGQLERKDGVQIGKSRSAQQIPYMCTVLDLHPSVHEDGARPGAW